jgi:YVTN family beta-propeller protein
VCIFLLERYPRSDGGGAGELGGPVGIRRALKTVAALALVLPLLAVAGPVAAQRQTAPVASTAQAAGLARAYVTDPFGSTVTVVDTSAFKVVTVIPVGWAAMDATLSPDESVLYVTSETAIHVISTATNTVTTTIPVGSFASGVAFTPDGTRAYAAITLLNTVSVINTATNSVVATIPLAEGSLPTEVAVSPNGARAYIVNTGAGTVSVITTATNTVIATIPVGVEPRSVAVTPDSARAYVTNSASASVSVIDTASNTVIATIPVGNHPLGVDVDPDGSKVFVVNNGTHRVSVIDVASSTVTKTLPTDIGSPINVEVTAGRIYVSGSHLSVIDRAVEAVVRTVIIAPDPEVPGFHGYGLAVSEGPRPAGNPTIATQASPSNIAGTLFSATATVTGGINPTGEVVFTIFRDANCVTEGAARITRPLVNGTATAEAFLDLAGTYYWRALYTGDANDNPATHPCSASPSVVVRPFVPPPFTRVITGDLSSPVTVNAGDSVQISNARVMGQVTVNPGGSLVVVNSDINRGIVATRPGFLSICGSRISGPSPNQALGLFDAELPVIIGDSRTATGCAGNRFAGSVNLIGNFGTVFDTNIVGGNLTVNTGGPGTTSIKANTIFGNLACSGNNPLDSTRPRVRNTVHGTRSGQCVGEF